MPRSDRRPRTRMDAEERRDAILAAAELAFGERPFSEVTIAEISEASGASDALIYRYFNGKDGLYTEVVQRAVADLTERQTAALGALHPRTPVEAQVRALLVAYLDHIAATPGMWALQHRQPGSEPGVVAEIRAQALQSQVGLLEGLLAPNPSLRHEYALWGFFGFTNTACQRWVEGGADPDQRWDVINAALGALQGALGDWAA